MSVLDSFFSKGGGAFRAAKCKTLLKLTIPRIKLLRNRREIQLKQMRKEIAKLLESGQEATARIRVEHIIREENMMAAQEILELFCELVVARLPIIEAQRECPLDLKEAISSICFAAPRCADLIELPQIQMMFAAKYGKEFVAAATELVPDCGVNRQMIELLSIRAPPVDVKMKLLKEIAEEHEIDWDPSATESEFLKPHEDLLNGPTYFNGSALPLPREKHEETLASDAMDKPHEECESDNGFESLDLPDVPRATVRPTSDVPTAPNVGQHVQGPPSDDPKLSHGSSNPTHLEENPTADVFLKAEPKSSETPVSAPYAHPSVPDVTSEKKQFIPFVCLPPFPSASVEEKEPVPSPPSISSVKPTESVILTKRSDEVISPPMVPTEYIFSKQEQPSSVSHTEHGANVDLEDVLSAAQTAAETAERAASAARAAANLAQLRIANLKKNTKAYEGCSDDVQKESCQTGVVQEPIFDHQGSFSGEPHKHGPSQVPQRWPSLEDDPYFSYPNLFSSKAPDTGSGFHSSGGNTGSGN